MCITASCFHVDLINTITQTNENYIIIYITYNVDHLHKRAKNDAYDAFRSLKSFINPLGVSVFMTPLKFPFLIFWLLIQMNTDRTFSMSVVQKEVR